MSLLPLPPQGSRAKKLDSRFRGNDKYRFRNRNYSYIIRDHPGFAVLAFQIFIGLFAVSK